jgi:Concanavalin A-like lectin/glucanases superfamily
MKTKKSSMLMIATVLFGTVLTISCGKDDVATLPAIGGFNTADDIASSSLVAHWGFNGNDKEDKTGSTATKTVGATYSTGVVGQGLTLTDGYLLYNGLASKLSALGTDVSMSVWANVKNNGGTTNEHATSIFMMTGGATVSSGTGPADACTAIMLETSHFSAKSDTVRVKSLVGLKHTDGSIRSEDNVNWWGLDNIKNTGQMVRTSGTWANYILIWDNTKKIVSLYVNGKKATNPEWEVKGGIDSFGSFTNRNIIFGGFMNNAGLTTAQETWAKPMTGMIDEARIFSKVLTDAEIGALYSFGAAGR